jgi:hypothetical protein
MTFPFLVVALGCHSDSTIGHPIEITGYLDPARMELTSRTQVGADETATIAVAGRPGATTSSEPLLIRNARSRTRSTRTRRRTAASGLRSTRARRRDPDRAGRRGGGRTHVDPFESLPEREVGVSLSDDHTRAVVHRELRRRIDEGWDRLGGEPALSLIADLERTGDARFEGQIDADPPRCSSSTAAHPMASPRCRSGSKFPQSERYDRRRRNREQARSARTRPAARASPLGFGFVASRQGSPSTAGWFAVSTW